MGWKTADFGEKPALVAAVSAADHGLPLCPDTCFIDMLDLPFYPGARLLKVTGENVPEAPRWYIRLGGDTMPANDGLRTVYYCNAHAPLRLNAETVEGYVRFYYYFGENGRVFENRIKRSSVGYTGKIWLYQRGAFFEIDINVSPRGQVTELEKIQIPDIPEFEPKEFTL